MSIPVIPGCSVVKYCCYKRTVKPVGEMNIIGMGSGAERRWTAACTDNICFDRFK